VTQKKIQLIDGIRFSSAHFLFNFVWIEGIRAADGLILKRNGAVELFEKACSSQSLKVSCQVVSSLKSDTLKKSLEMARPDAGSFIINGSKIDKIYQISELK